jgi:hypothetical protein
VLCLDDPFLGLGREVADKVGDAIRASRALCATWGAISP